MQILIYNKSNPADRYTPADFFVRFNMNRLLGFVALVGFVLSLVVHISALMGMDFSENAPWVWALHVGIFIVFFPFVFSIRKSFGTKPSLAEVREAFPPWILAIVPCVFAYAIVNFFLFIVATQGGNPSVLDGKYVLLNHGKLIRELTLSEYVALKANELRGFSGHWMFFYFVPFAYFTFNKKSNHAMQRIAEKAGSR